MLEAGRVAGGPGLGAALRPWEPLSGEPARPREPRAATVTPRRETACTPEALPKAASPTFYGSHGTVQCGAHTARAGLIAVAGGQPGARDGLFLVWGNGSRR